MLPKRPQTALKIIFLIFLSFPLYSFGTLYQIHPSINNLSSKTSLNTSDTIGASSHSISNSVTQSITTQTNTAVYNESKVTSTYIMGDIVKFWAQNLAKEQAGDSMSQYMYQISAEVVNITQNAYIFVDTLIVSYYTSGLASQIGQEFETKIQPSDIKLGTPSDIDHNGKIIILIYPFIETSSSTYTTGYFWPLNMYNTSTNPKNPFYYSEYKEIIYINDRAIEGTNHLVQPSDSWAPTLAHEYFHLIHYKYNPYEDVWLEEGLAVFAEHLAGFKSGYLSYLQDGSGNGYFLHAYDESLTYFGQTLEHYGASFLFVLYFYDRFGLTFIKDIVQTTLSGMTAIKYYLNKFHINETFNQIYSDWVATNVLNDPANSTYAYPYFTNSFAYKISASQYNGKLQIIPSQFTQQIFPYWSNQFYTLPQNALQPYQITFFPELPDSNSTYLLSVITKFTNGTWNIENIPLVNDQSGSFIIQYKSKSDQELLVLSSLTGTSSGQYSIDDSQMYTTYFSTYNLYLNNNNYFVSYNLLGVKNYLPNYAFNISTVTGQKIALSNIKNISLNVYSWNNNKLESGIHQGIYYNSSSQSWVIPDSSFTGLPYGQYYFNLSITLNGGTQISGQGLTFLIKEAKKTNQSSNYFQNPVFYYTVSLIIILIIIDVAYRKMGRKRK